MKKITSYNRGTKAVPNGRIITFGLTPEQNNKVKNALPAKNYELLNTNAATDLIAISASALIINVDEMDHGDVKMILDFYDEVHTCTDESVFWIAATEPPKSLRTFLKHYKNFDEFSTNLKYHLLSAHTKTKKANDFSRKVSDCLKIIHEVRRKPYVKTQELSEKLDIPIRTVQRHIATLQMAGEWLEYDSTRRGWYLQYGVSILMGDEL